MPSPLTLEGVEQRLTELQPLIDGLALDLANDGVNDLDDVDPDDGSWAEPERHLILAWNRALAVKAEIERTGVALDPLWIPPPTDTTK